MPSINLAGVSHTYELTAPAENPQFPTLVFVHGWLLSRRYWQPLIQILESQYQCLTYDLRGFGDSASQRLLRPKRTEPALSVGESASRKNSVHISNGQYSLDAYAHDLKLLLQQLKLDKVWLVGHSLGGSIALWTANICPQQVEGVICLNSGGGIYLKEEFERFRNVGQQLVKFRPNWLRYFPFIDLAFARMMVARPLSSSWGRQRVIDFIKAEPEAALGALLQSTTESEVHLLPQIVAKLHQPVYFLAGAKDKVMELKYVNHLASFHQLFRQNGSNVFEIENCGHLGMLEEPEQVASILSHILQQNLKSA